MRLYLGLLLLLPALVFSKPWSHIEYGAGNYGTANVYSNPFEKSDYTVLLNTLDKLVETKGSKGIFYVNDYEEEWAQLAADTLAKYAKDKGWEIEIRVLAGDATKIQVPVTDTAHLKNPNLGLIKKNQTTGFLQKLADHSETGLQITTYFYDELKKHTRKGQAVRLLDEPGDFYHFPSGDIHHKRTQHFRISRGKDLSTKPSQHALMGRNLDDVNRVKIRGSRCRRFFRDLWIDLNPFGWF